MRFQKKILQVLAPLDLDPELCVGFCIDGSSVMSGAKGGVQTILKHTFPHAVYVDCCSHHLNLILSSVAKVSRHVNTFFETLMTGSSLHARFTDIQKELNPARQCLACSTWSWSGQWTQGLSRARSPRS